MARRPWRGRHLLAAASAAVMLVGGQFALVSGPAIAQGDALEESALGQAALYLTGADLAEYRPAPGVPGRLIVDAKGDTTGTAPAPVPAGLVDIQDGAIFVIPAADTTVLRRTCLTPPPGVVVSCTAPSITGDMALVLFRLGAPLPGQWSPDDLQRLFVGDVVDTTPDTTDGIGDPFHGAGTAVESAGYGARGWDFYFEGTADPLKPPFIALFPSTGIAAVGLPVAALKYGARPFVSFAGPPQTPAQGAFDLLGDPGTPPSLIRVGQPLTFGAELFGAAGLTPDPALVPWVVTYDDRPADLFFSGTDATAGVTDPAVDFRWSDGVVVAPALDPAAIEAAYPCGTTNARGAFTLCAPRASAAKGPYALVQGGLDAAIPRDGDRMLVYGAAFDGDGRSVTGLKPGADFPNDTYQGTDRWYEATYEPDKMAWTMGVTDQTLKHTSRGNATARSGARAIIDGPSISWLIPLSEFQAQLPSWRLTSAITDGTFAQATTGVDVSAGGPGSTWTLQPLSDPGGLVVIVPPKPAVVGGCAVSQPPDQGSPVTLKVTAEVVGLDGIAKPAATMVLTYGAGSTTTGNGISVTNGLLVATLPVQEGQVAFTSLIVYGGKKPIDLTKSWQKTFGKSIKVTGKGGQHAGPDCP